MKSSALGNYVHLNTENYIKYGVLPKNKEGKSNPYVATTNFLSRRIRGLKEINKKTLQTLQQRVANNTPAKIKQDEQKTLSAYNKHMDQILSFLAKTTESELMGRLHGQLVHSGFTSYNENEYDILRSKYLTGSKEMQQQTLKRKQENIRRIKQLIKEINSNKLTNDEIEIRIKEINDLYAELDFPDELIEGAETGLGKLQAALDNVSINTTWASLVGQWGELLVSSASDEIVDNIESSIEDIIKNVKGGETSKIIFDPNSLAADLSKYTMEVTGKDKKTGESVTRTVNVVDKAGNKFTLGASQNKVDATIMVNGVEIDASVKSYALSSEKSDGKVALQKDIDLFSSLLFLNGYIKQFGTHWLNMHAATMSVDGKENADLILQQEIAYEALVSGNPLKQGASRANTLVVIDTSSGKVYAESTKDLLTNHLERFSMSDIAGIHLANKKADTYEDRIANILIQTRQKRLTVKYNPTG